MELLKSHREVNEIFDLFYMNKFDEAYSRCDEKLDTSILHSHMKGFLIFLYSLLTLESDEIAKGKEQVEKTLAFLTKKRKVSSISENLSNFFWKPDVNKYTNLEVHAELIYAECQVMMGLLTFFGDQSIMSLIKGALRINASNQSFKFCQTILNERKVWGSEELKMHFESGVCNGIGVFNLVVSLLPKNIMKLLTIVGFSGDKQVALDMIKRCTTLKEGLRNRVSILVIETFSLYIEQLMGMGEIDSDWVGSLVDDVKSRFPKAVFVLFFSGKYKLLKGQPDKAAKEFLDCLALQDEWRQVHNICNWDLIWCYGLQNDWQNAMNRAKVLRNECAYSPATNEYQYAIFKMMKLEEENYCDIKGEVHENMENVLKLKKRYAGKTIPQEKFLCTRAKLYLEEGGRTPLVALLEMYYVWNVLSMTGNNTELIDPLLEKTDKKLRELQNEELMNAKFDDIGVLLLVKGVLLRNRNDNGKAEQCFHEIIESGNKITRDTFIVPHATLELGITYLKARKISEATKWLNKAKSGGEKFLNESVVSLRSEIEKGKAEIERTVQLCVRKRKTHTFVESFTTFIWKIDVDRYTDYEVHAELIYGECQIFMGLLTFFGDQSIMSLIKGALRMTTANNCFKFCQKILKERQNWESDEAKMHFESGVYNGIGIFNLVLSCLPKKILKLLTIAGFSGDRNIALSMIKKCTNLKEGIRRPGAVIVIQTFNIYFEQIMGLSEIDSEWIESLVDENRKRYPNSVFVLFFSARSYLLKGEPEKASKELIKCIEIQDSWKQVHNICYWDLVWSCALRNDWENAAEYSKLLRIQSPYSPATNEYQFAVFKLMQMEDEKRGDLKEIVDASMKSVGSLKKRYAGKTIPQEKFVCTRASQYSEEGRLPLVALLELFYIWNILSMTNDNETLIKPLIARIDRAREELKQNDKARNDDRFVLLLAKGVLLRNKKDFGKAEQCFLEIINSEEKIIRDTYIVPHTTLELGITYLKCEEYEKANIWLNKTKCCYEKFLNESIVNLRVTAALRKLSELKVNE
ncbi:tetratricopeptide repeat protein 39B-like protein [Dinothrombium tinctorium]|uniref:Tetratricopeptide repeat protein 39B-like protein n=1 Tax=Dinothrombium tinctorium TaxID=1965070 RepID=A0A3S4RGE6_9ACAR|nr:tetratricopeptide repeat protein 39B-like protein [Dinothrombium tinctorium]